MPNRLPNFSKNLLIPIPQGEFYTPGALVKLALKQNHITAIQNAKQFIGYYHQLQEKNIVLLIGYINYENSSDLVECFVQARGYLYVSNNNYEFQRIDEYWDESIHAKNLLLTIWEYYAIQNKKIFKEQNASFYLDKPLPISFWRLLQIAQSIPQREKIEILLTERLMDGLYLFVDRFFLCHYKNSHIDKKERYILRYQELLRTKKFKSDIQSVMEDELAHLAEVPSTSQEFSHIVNYLNFITELPTSTEAKLSFNFTVVEEIFKKNLFGMESVQAIVLDYLAGYSLNSAMKGANLCFVGPPGVGKTSIAKIVAESLQRKLVILSLNGLRDEGFLKGHSRHYLGARPGKIIEAIKQYNSTNLVILLDEVDKVNQIKDLNIASILLELMDRELSQKFLDHYLGFPIDLSNIIFILTANNEDLLSVELQSRLEIISFSAYSKFEKKHIFNEYLLPKIKYNLEIEHWKITFSDNIVEYMINIYTQESGVRKLTTLVERLFKRLVRLYIEQIEQALIFNFNNMEDIRNYIDLPAPLYFLSTLPLERGKIAVMGYDKTNYYIYDIEIRPIVDKQNILTITGSDDRYLRDRIILSQEVISYYCTENYLNNRWIRESGFHINISQSGINELMRELTLPLIVLHLSLIKNIKKNMPKTLILGDVNLTGDILTHCKIKELIIQAERYGFEAIILGENMQELGEHQITKMESYLKIYYFKNIDNVIKFLFEHEDV